MLYQKNFWLARNIKGFPTKWNKSSQRFLPHWPSFAICSYFASRFKEFHNYREYWVIFLISGSERISDSSRGAWDSFANTRLNPSSCYQLWVFSLLKTINFGSTTYWLSQLADAQPIAKYPIPRPVLRPSTKPTTTRRYTWRCRYFEYYLLPMTYR